MKFKSFLQEDPLSPYIFLLWSEVLSGLSNKALEDGNLHGIRVARRSPRLNHLLFADDTIFFYISNKQSCKTLTTILNQYEKAITFSSKTLLETRTRVITHLSISRKWGVEKYLGLHEHFGRRKKDLFSLIIDRIRERAINWSSKFLSTTGKMTLVKSVLTAISTYTMSCFKLPLNLCKIIQSALTRLWWDTKMDQKNLLGCLEQTYQEQRCGKLGFQRHSSLQWCPPS